MNVSLVLYDVSGTLTNPSFAIYEATRRALNSQNLKLKSSAYEVYKLRGIPGFEKTERFIPILIEAKRGEIEKILDMDVNEINHNLESLKRDSKLSIDLIREMCRVFRGFYHSFEAGIYIRYPNDLMNHLFSMKDSFTLGIVTNSGIKIIERDLGSYIDFFSVLVSKENTPEAKPSGKGIIFAMNKLKKTGKETLFIGDSVSDILAGNDSGCLTCALTSGMGHQALLEKANPSFTASTLTEVQKLIEPEKY